MRPAEKKWDNTKCRPSQPPPLGTKNFDSDPLKNPKIGLGGTYSWWRRPHNGIVYKSKLRITQPLKKGGLIFGAKTSEKFWHQVRRTLCQKSEFSGIKVPPPCEGLMWQMRRERELRMWNGNNNNWECENVKFQKLLFDITEGETKPLSATTPLEAEGDSLGRQRGDSQAQSQEPGLS